MTRCGNLNHESCGPQIPLELDGDGDVKQWEEARCPICMEHPHNAVILQCSSYDNGCRPFICNTSYRHSNCLDQFCKSSVSCPSTLTVERGISSTEANSDMNGLADLDFDFEGIFSPIANSGMNEQEDLDFGGVFSPGENSNMNGLEDLDFEGGDMNGQEDLNSESEQESKLTCPLCRGEVYGWFVVDAARKYMNAKTRDCSCEDCDFSGNYVELRKHARSVHPTARPLKVDPERQQNWDMMQLESNTQGLINSIREVVEADVDIQFGGVQSGDAEIELERPSFLDFEEMPSLEFGHFIEGFRNLYAPVANEVYDHFVSTFAEISRRNRNISGSNIASLDLNSRVNNLVRNQNNDVARTYPLERTSSNQNRNSYRENRANNIYTGQNNDFTAIVVETVFRSQNDSEENNTTDFNSRQNNGFSADAGERVGSNCGEGNTNDLNSRQNNDFRGNLAERVRRNQNNCEGNNTNDCNSVQNNDYSANMAERVRRNRNNHGENNTNYFNSRHRHNDEFGANRTWSILRNQNRHGDHISGYNYTSNTRQNNLNSRQNNIFEGNRNERRQRWIDNSRHGSNVNRRPSNRR